MQNPKRWEFEPMDDDSFRAARGTVNGLLIGSAIWAVILAVMFLR